MNFKITDTSDARISDIAKSMYNYSLREAMVSLCKQNGIKEIPKAKDSKELLLKFHEVPSTSKEKVVSLYKSEVSSPSRHLFLAHFDGVPSWSALDAEKKFTDKIEGYFLHFRYLDKTREAEGIYNLIYDHNWEYNYRQEIKASANKKRRWEEANEIRRHSIVARIDTKKNSLTLAYQGFQGGGEKYLSGGIVYESMCKLIIEKITDQLNITIKSLNLREVIKHISGRSTPKFSVDMIDSRYKQLELFLRKGKGKHSILEEISEALAAHLNTDLQTVFSAFQEVIARSKVEEAELKWNGFKAKTIIRFLAIGPELKFNWEKDFNGLDSQNQIADLLIELASFSSQNQSQDFWKYISEIPINDVCDIVSIQQQTGLSPTSAKEALISGLEMGLLIPVYKLNTQMNIVDYTNNWKENLTPFKRKFTLENGEVLNGENISNIIIAFKKTMPKGDA